MVVFPGWFIEQTSQKSRDIWLLNPKALPHFLENEPRQLSDEEAKLAIFHLSRFIRASETIRTRS